MGGGGDYSDNIQSVNVNMDEALSSSSQNDKVHVDKKEETNKKNKFTSWVGFYQFHILQVITFHLTSSYTYTHCSYISSRQDSSV